jgi:hypothetical protein
MNLFFVAYDLNRPQQNYPRLWEALRNAGARRLLASEWALRSSSTLEALYRYFAQFVDRDDGLVVTAVSNAFGSGTQTPMSQL